jgi:transposase
MANNPIGPFMLKEIIRLKIQGYSHKKISSIIGKSRPVIIKYVKAIEASGFSYAELQIKTDWEIHELFENNKSQILGNQNTNHPQLTNFFSYGEKELLKPGVTKQELWEEYKIKNSESISYSRFCFHFKKWLKNNDSYMPIEHKAGDKLYVDHAGKKLRIVDPDTGEIHEKEVFVATLGASQQTYVEACDSQKLPDYLKVLENALHFFGGVPACIVPDNLKSAVTKPCKYEAEVNKHLLNFANHYDTVIMPARSLKPKDKALVEGAVKIVYTRIYSKIRNQVYHSLEELNTAIAIHTKDYNNINFQRKDYSRNDVFVDLDKPALKALPTTLFELKDYRQSTVQKNSHIYIAKDKNYYSVPYIYVGRKVTVIISLRTIEVYSNHQRIAFHTRLTKSYQYSTLNEHMPPTDRFLNELSIEKIIKMAKEIGASTTTYIQKVLDNHSHQEQNFKSCIGILSLSKKAGNDRLENACKRAIAYDVFSFKTIQNILAKGLDAEDEEEKNTLHIPEHDNIRGRKYYQ